MPTRFDPTQPLTADGYTWSLYDPATAEQNWQQQSANGVNPLPIDSDPLYGLSQGWVDPDALRSAGYTGAIPFPGVEGEAGYQQAPVGADDLKKWLADNGYYYGQGIGNNRTAYTVFDKAGHMVGAPSGGGQLNDPVGLALGALGIGGFGALYAMGPGAAGAAGSASAAAPEAGSSFTSLYGAPATQTGESISLAAGPGYTGLGEGAAVGGDAAANAALADEAAGLIPSGEAGAASMVGGGTGIDFAALTPAQQAALGAAVSDASGGGALSWLGKAGSSVGDFLSNVWNGDPKSLNQLKMIMGGLGLAGSLLGKPKNQQTPGQIQSQLNPKYNNWTPTQQATFDKFTAPRPFVYQREPNIIGNVTDINPSIIGHASGGPVHPSGCSCAYCSGGPVGMAMGGRFVSAGAGGGQSDSVDARLSPGEYVMDADVVSALGDGDNATGAARLDEMRERVRRHKRGAPAGDIPPPARSPLSYLRGR